MTTHSWTSSARPTDLDPAPYGLCCGLVPTVLHWKRQHHVSVVCANPVCPNHQGVIDDSFVLPFNEKARREHRWFKHRRSIADVDTSMFNLNAPDPNAPILVRDPIEENSLWQARAMLDLQRWYNDEASKLEEAWREKLQSIQDVYKNRLAELTKEE